MATTVIDWQKKSWNLSKFYCSPKYSPKFASSWLFSLSPQLSTSYIPQLSCAAPPLAPLCKLLAVWKWRHSIQFVINFHNNWFLATVSYGHENWKFVACDPKLWSRDIYGANKIETGWSKKCILFFYLKKIIIDTEEKLNRKPLVYL